MLQALLPILGSVAKTVAGSLFPDPADKLRRDEAEYAFNRAVMEHADKLDELRADIIKTEAASSHWLAANWRPVTALIFVGLIVARWLGFAAPGMTEAEYLKVYELIYIMIGGYTIARSVEKTAPSIAAAITGKRK